MSSISDFFNRDNFHPKEINQSALRFFYTTQCIPIPSTVCYMAYGVIGAGGWGPGGGFSYKDAEVTCGSNFCVCVEVGQGFTYCDYNCRAGSTSISGICAATISATGGYGGNNCCCFSGCASSPGVGSGGDINTCGGNGGWQDGGVFMTGGGAGGLFGNGGNGGCGSWGGGGGFGSGGGGGGGGVVCSGSYNSACGNNGQMGGLTAGSVSTNTGVIGHNYGCGGAGYFGAAGASTGANFRECSQNHAEIITSEPQDAQIQYVPGYTKNGQYSQAKTFLGAAGGGAATLWCKVDTQMGSIGGRAAPGGGSAPGQVAGFGGGSARLGSHVTHIGGGGFCSNGIGIIEFWISE